ncbi:MAG: DUF2786 domain-containing protein, partial [Desulfobacterales bacterium]|nr:DUF2786 domain-containing protein [Desulfobacterales bacterium]
ILYGLSCQWETFLWDVEHVYKMAMRKPLFSLGDMNGKLGCWRGDEREIRLSRNFVMNHPWDSVCEVLRHEMAHQMADQVFMAGHEKPHGSTFQQACRLLRAEPRASDSYPTLRERLAGKATDQRDKIMARVKKLLALAESSNTHEAESAMMKAHELIAKYNIDLINANERREFMSIFLGKPALRRWREDYHLASLIQDFYFVQGIWVPAYVLDKEKMGRVLELSGTARNLKIAEYVFEFVRRYIDARWLEYKRGKKLNRYRKTDFAVGVIHGFRDKLESQRYETFSDKSGVTDLVAAKDPLLQRYLKQKHPRTSSIRRTVSSQDERIRRDGVGIGRELVISEGITENRKGRVLKIGAPD